MEKHPQVETEEGYQFSFLLIFFFFGKLFSYAQMLYGNKIVPLSVYNTEIDHFFKINFQLVL